jgi:hypothetical protein
MRKGDPRDADNNIYKVQCQYRFNKNGKGNPLFVCLHPADDTLLQLVDFIELTCELEARLDYFGQFAGVDVVFGVRKATPEKPGSQIYEPETL